MLSEIGSWRRHENSVRFVGSVPLDVLIAPCATQPPHGVIRTERGSPGDRPRKTIFDPALKEQWPIIDGQTPGA